MPLLLAEASDVGVAERNNTAAASHAALVAIPPLDNRQGVNGQRHRLQIRVVERIEQGIEFVLGTALVFGLSLG